MLLDHDWPTRLENERRLGNISFGQARVLLELWRLVIVGDCEPSEERLKTLAGVSRSTVTRAKAAGRAMGMIGWERQRDPGAGIRRERPCLYRIQTPTAPLIRRVRHVAERQVSRSIQQQLATLPMPTEAHRAMLAARSARLFGERRELTG